MTGALLSLLLAAALPLATTPSPTATTTTTTAVTFPQELQPLVAALRRAGYSVKLEPPPLRGAYGLTDRRHRRIWIAPITLELGLMRPSLIHEAVHAAQGCGSGRQQPIGWTVQLDPLIQREIRGLLYRGYPHATFDIEREAFGMQSHPQAIPLLIKALAQRCRAATRRVPG